VIRKTHPYITGVSASPASDGNVIITRSYSAGSLITASAAVSFYPLDSNFIGRVFPTDRRDVRTTGNDPVNVGVTFGLYVDMIVKDVSYSAVSCTAIPVTSQLVGNKFQPAATPTIISQGYGPAGSASVYDMFKIISTGQGRGTNTDVKIRISNISFDDTR
jgi:hypothetical protein